MPPKSRAYNIVIIPPKDIVGRAIKASRSLRKLGVFFTLDSKKYFPHITLYMAEFPQKNLAKVQEELEKISKHSKKFKIQSSHYKQEKYRHEDGWIHVSFKKSPTLLRLQKQIISKTNNLRDGLLMKSDRARLTDAPNHVKKNLEKYGFSNAFYKFSIPHITFTRLKKSNPKALKNLKEQNFSFSVQKIGIFEKEEHGTCRKLVREFKLN